MDVFDKILKEHSWKFPKGYPDMDDVEDRTLLENIINGYLTEAEEEVELADDKEVLGIKAEPKDDPQGGSQVYNDTIRHALYKKDWEDKPIPRPKKKYPYQQNTFTVTVAEEDQEMFDKLYPVKPPKVGQPIGSAGSLGVGNGEIALYWLYHFSDSADVEEGREGDDPDLFFNKQGVEVKSWKSHKGKHGLGRFGDDRDNLSLLAVIFGFNALATVFGDGEEVSSTVNPTNFKGSELIEAMAKVKEFKRIIDNNTELVNNYPLFKSIKDNADRVYRQLAIGDDEDPRGMAMSMALKLLEPKLTRKPGDGNHLVNVKSDGNMKFFQINFSDLENDDLLNDFVVKQSAIVIDFDKIWG